MYVYDRLPYNQRLLLDVQMREYLGTVCYDHAKPHHILTHHGPPIWRQTVDDLDYLDFEAGTPDFLDVPAVSSADLNFTASNFTLAAWVNYESVGFRYLYCKGLTDTDGWEWAINTDSALWLRTNQAGAGVHQDTISANAVVPIATWTFLATVRNGATVVHYVNGVVSIGVAGVHVNPVTAVAREFHVGINDAETAGWYDGGLWRPRVWSGALTAAEVARVFTIERGLLGV